MLPRQLCYSLYALVCYCYIKQRIKLNGYFLYGDHRGVFTKFVLKRQSQLWSCLELFGAVYSCSELFGAVWSCLELFEDVRSCLELSACRYKCTWQRSLNKPTRGLFLSV